MPPPLVRCPAHSTYRRPKHNPFLLLTAVCILLIALHGLFMFAVDTTTLGLLVLAALPFAYEFATSLKAGNLEIRFRDLTTHEQIFTFLDGIARKSPWTFYAPRSNELPLGKAFQSLVQELEDTDLKKLLACTRRWLKSDEPNQRWFAAEVIGHFRLEKLRDTVLRAVQGKPRQRKWELWELNCLWAASRFDDEPYDSLKKFLRETNNRSNEA
jgi:hypothetical protein